MDATSRPIVFPPEFENYVEEHNIFSLFEACLESLVIARPQDPLQFLESVFSSPVTDIHKIIVFGPPVQERTVICQRLCDVLQTVHVSSDTLKGKQISVQKKEGIKLKKVLVRFEKRVRDKRNKYFIRDASRSRKDVQKVGKHVEGKKRRGEEKIEEPKHHLEYGRLEDLKEIAEETEFEESNIPANAREDNLNVSEEDLNFEEDDSGLEDLGNEEHIFDAQTNKGDYYAQEYIDNDGESYAQEDLDRKEYIQEDISGEEQEYTQEHLDKEYRTEEETKMFDIINEESEGRASKGTDEKNALEYAAPFTEEGAIEDFGYDDEDFLKYAWGKEEVQEEGKCLFESEREETELSEMGEEEVTPLPTELEDEDEGVLFRERTPLLTKLMKRLNSQECTTKGWLLEGIPKSRLEALSLQQWAVFPTHVIFLIFEKAPSSMEVEEIVHTSNKEEWILYNEQISGIEDCYSRYYCQSFLIDKPLDSILMSILDFTDSKPSSNAPFTPRVFLLGLPGCGKSTQAQRLAEIYDIVNIDFSELVKHVLSLESKWDSENQSVIDELAAEAVAERIHRNDALIGGYILHGFPSTLRQAKILCEKLRYRMPNRVIVMDISKETSYERLVYRRIDPFHRRFYHLLNDPPKDDNLFLFQRPQDEHSVVVSRICSYFRNIKDLLKFYEGRLTRIDAEMTIEDVSEALVCSIVQPIPNREYLISEGSGK